MSYINIVYRKIITNKSADVFWILLSQITLLGVNFVLLKVMTSNLSVKSFGYYSLCMTIVLFLRQIFYDPLSYVIVKDCGIYGNKNEFLEVSKSAASVNFITDRSAILLVFITLFILFINHIFSDELIYGSAVFCCVFYFFSNGTQGIYLAILNILNFRKVGALFSIFDSLLKFSLVYFSFLMFGDSLTYLFLSIAAGAFISFIMLRGYIKTHLIKSSRLNANINKNSMNYIIRSVPLFVPTLLMSLRGVGDRWVLAAYIGVDELAAFTVLLQIGYFPIVLLIGIMQTYVAPKIYGLCAFKDDIECKKLKKFLIKILFLIFVFSCVAFFISIIIEDLIFKFFVGAYYNVFSKYLPVFVFSGALSALSGIFHLAVIGVFDTRFAGKVVLSSVSIGMVFSFILINMFYFSGAVFSLLLSGFVSTLIYFSVLYVRVFRVK